MASRARSFAASGTIAVKGGTTIVHGVNILAAGDAATVTVIGATSGIVYGAAGAAAGSNAGCAFGSSIVVDESDAVLTITVTGTAPKATVVFD